jgi:hypothetical protein
MAEEQQRQGRDATSRRQGDRYLLSSDDIRTFHTNGYVHLKVQCRFLMLPWLLAAAASAHEVSFISFLISIFCWVKLRNNHGYVLLIPQKLFSCSSSLCNLIAVFLFVQWLKQQV